MCGICGILNYDGLDESDLGAISRMTGSLKHRGPDETATWHDGRIALGHTRLSIVDIDGGSQPMASEDGSVMTVFNGEIYNFTTLRDYLVRKGHVFKSRSDTEVIIHGYESYAEQITPKLDGMFAFAVWDAAAGTLILARDRIGKKPLYYTFAGRKLVFASEIKALLLHPSVRREPDISSLYHMLSFQHTPGDSTAFKDIYKLTPANFALIKPTGISQHCYWRAEMIPTDRKHIARKNVLALPDLIQDAVEQRLMGDVPVGAFLSGGVDSSAIVALMSRLIPGNVHTFSIGFDDDDFDETHYARLVADRFDTIHTEFTVTGNELLDHIPSLVWHCDEPFMDSSILPSYLLAKLTREHVKVALSGDGGDELFAGYERYIADRYLHYYNYIPDGVRRGFLSTAFTIGARLTADSTGNRLNQMARFSKLTDAERHLNWFSFFDPADKAALFAPEVTELICNLDSASHMEALYERASARDHDFSEQQFLADILSYLPETLMMKVDRASMAVGLEVRSPLLSKSVAELALSLPADMKLRGTTTKFVLKQAMRNILPPEIIYRRKQGFQVPLDSWFRGPLRNTVSEILTDPATSARGIFNHNTVGRILAEHQTGTQNHGHKLWALLNIELWFRLFLDGPAPTGPRTLF